MYIYLIILVFGYISTVTKNFHQSQSFRPRAYSIVKKSSGTQHLLFAYVLYKYLFPFLVPQKRKQLEQNPSRHFCEGVKKQV